MTASTLSHQLVLSIELGTVQTGTGKATQLGNSNVPRLPVQEMYNSQDYGFQCKSHKTVLKTNYKLTKNNPLVINMFFITWMECTRWWNDNSGDRNTMEQEYDIIALLRSVWCCYKANSFTRNLLHYKFNNLVKWTCFHWTIVVSYARSLDF